MAYVKWLTRYYLILFIGVASYGALGHVPPSRLPASYFGDHSLYRLTSHAHGFLSSRAFSGVFLKF